MTYEEWMRFARDEPRVVGLIVTGSRGRGALVHDTSDWDLRVVVQDGEEAFADALDTPHGGDVEVATATLSALRASPQWDRYSYAHAQVPVDKLDGALGRLVDARGTLGEAEAHELARESLSAYTNSLYRSLRDAELGLDVAARLDATDAVSALLTALFAFEQRVRPFNKYLRWELQTFPLLGWNANALLDMVDAALAGEADAQRRLLRAVEPGVRAQGLGELIDEWEPHVSFLRGGR
jgi:hypothetical protein